MREFVNRFQITRWLTRSPDLGLQEINQQSANH
jgi:hypothetical protein